MAKGTKKAAAPKRARAKAPDKVANEPQAGDDIAARKGAVRDQFSEADAQAEATLGRQIRGY